MLGAMVSRFSIYKNAADKDDILVDFLNVDEMEEFKNFSGKKFLRYGEKITYDPKDLQSFTLTPFKIPEIMNYQGFAMVIDPDIFAVTDIAELFSLDLGNNVLAARAKRGAWDTSVMLLDCSKLKHWNINRILDDLANFRIDYGDWMTLHNEGPILELPPEWNSWDELNEKTKLLHTTRRVTQPWKTGLPIDFRWNEMGKIFGLISKRWLFQKIGKLPHYYQPHPNKQIESFFFSLLKEAVDKKNISYGSIQEEIKKGHIRPDAIRLLESTNLA